MHLHGTTVVDSTSKVSSKHNVISASLFCASSTPCSKPAVYPTSTLTRAPSHRSNRRRATSCVYSSTPFRLALLQLLAPFTMGCGSSSSASSTPIPSTVANGSANITSKKTTKLDVDVTDSGARDTAGTGKTDEKPKIDLKDEVQVQTNNIGDTTAANGGQFLKVPKEKWRGKRGTRGRAGSRHKKGKGSGWLRLEVPTEKRGKRGREGK